MEPKSNPSTELLNLAKNHFGKLTANGKRLFEAATKGEVIDFGGDPKSMKKDDKVEDYTLQAEYISWLCTDKAASAYLAFSGLKIKGAKIVDSLNFDFVTIHVPLYFEYCLFTNHLLLQQAKLKGLYLTGSHLSYIDATRVNIEGDLSINWDAVVETGASFYAAKIQGNMDCSNASFSNKGGNALNAEGAVIGGNVFLGNGFKAEGVVRFYGAKINGAFSGNGGHFLNKDKSAINAEASKIGGGVFLNGNFRAEGDVRLYGVTIDGVLDCSQGSFINPSGYAINASAITVKSDVFLTNIKSEGEIGLYGASIGSTLDCTNAELLNKDGKALELEGAKVSGYIFFSKGFKAEGAIRMYGTNVGRGVDCGNGEFSNDHGESLNMERANINGYVLLRDGFKATGCVRLYRATIGSTLDCSGGQFSGKNTTALEATGSTIRGDVFFREGFKADGGVVLYGSNIDGTIDCTKGEFIKEYGNAFDMEGAKVNGDVFLNFKITGNIRINSASIQNYFVYRGVEATSETILDLRSCKIGTLWDEERSWPDVGKLYLDGFTYGSIDSNSPLDHKSRLKWIRLQKTEPFSPQPYEQLATVLQESGHENAARQVLIAKQHDLRKFGDLTLLNKFVNLLLGLLVSHGYKPHRAFRLMIVWIIIGAFVFDAGYSLKLIYPSDASSDELKDPSVALIVAEEYPVFNSFVYSIDAFVPIVNLHQLNYWLPDANKGSEINILGANLKKGSLLRIYLWFHIAFGWIFTSFWVAGLTGLVKKG
ncbi:hypothetical protein QQ008_04210 [Fulvivirgaceae bacterium BMA10]|uniref:Membrane-associated oxidoreductase n=1 Tax=Splendidivirga corallicola TaxID=3051826 RepID=A0ABT8KII7_9BACT|nr:hypothetical protein [Fulvivirgaceae bacterium BMA10]